MGPRFLTPAYVGAVCACSRNSNELSVQREEVRAGRMLAREPRRVKRLSQGRLVERNFKFPANPSGNRFDASCDVSRQSVGIRNRREPSVKLLFRPTFTPTLAEVTFDWTPTLNWFRLKSHPPSPPLLPFLRPSLVHPPLQERVVVRHPRFSALSLCLSFLCINVPVFSPLSFVLPACVPLSRFLSAYLPLGPPPASSSLVQISFGIRDAYVQAGRNAFRSAPFSIGRIPPRVHPRNGGEKRTTGAVSEKGGRRRLISRGSATHGRRKWYLQSITGDGARPFEISAISPADCETMRVRIRPSDTVLASSISRSCIEHCCATCVDPFGSVRSEFQIFYADENQGELNYVN